MPKINILIPNASFEFVRDRIAEILADELNHQQELSNDPEKLKVYIERSVPFDKSQLPALNVMLDVSSWNNRHAGSTRGEYNFLIDAQVGAINDMDGNADTQAALKAQRLIAKARFVLEDPQYYILGFSAGFVERVTVTEMLFGSDSNKDIRHTQIARLKVTVLAIETGVFVQPNVLDDYKTEVKLNDTNQGYYYSK